MTTKKQLLIKQTGLILLALLIGWFSIYNKWYGYFFNLWFFSIFMSFFLVPVMMLYFFRKNNYPKLGKFFRFLIYFFIIGVFLILLSYFIDFLLAMAFITNIFNLLEVGQALYYSFYFDITRVGAMIINLVIIGLSWWAIRVNKSFHKLWEK